MADFISDRQVKATEIADEMETNPFTTMTKTELLAWLDNNIDDPATKTAFKFTARMLKIMWNEMNE